MPVGVGAKPATPPGGAKPAAAPGGKPAAPPAAPPAGAEGGKKGGKLKLIIIIVAAVVVLAAVAVGVLFALKALGIIGGGGEADAKPTEEPAVMGTQMVTSGESGVTVNLADGAHMVVHFNVYFTAKLDEDSSSSEHGSSKEIDTGPAVRAVQMALDGRTPREGKEDRQDAQRGTGAALSGARLFGVYHRLGVAVARAWKRNRAAKAHGYCKATKRSSRRNIAGGHGKESQS